MEYPSYFEGMKFENIMDHLNNDWAVLFTKEEIDGLHEEYEKIVSWRKSVKDTKSMEERFPEYTASYENNIAKYEEKIDRAKNNFMVILEEAIKRVNQSQMTKNNDESIDMKH